MYFPVRRSSWRRLGTKVSSEDFARYLEDYARSKQLSVRQRTKVLHVRKASDSGTFDVETDGGVQRTRLVVCASGHYQNPYIPTLPGGNDGSLFTLHASGYVNPQSLIEASGGGRKILIIGKRITAGQMMQDLHEQGFTVCLSARSPVKMRARWRMNVWKERLYFLYEAIFVRLFPRIKATSRPIMDGGEKADLLDVGAIRRVGEVRAIQAGKVYFTDGSSESFNVVIFATGYRPALRYLELLIPFDEHSGMPTICDMESCDVRGLFFLGLENLRNFLSPYLRGIRSDARVLARMLCRRLDSQT